MPEGLAAVTTVVLSLGMQRMARRHVIVRKLAAVETLGATSVVCTDKTGTLTRNEMTVRAIVTASGRVDVSGTGYAPEGTLRHGGASIGHGPLADELEATIAAATLANNARLVHREGRWTVAGDPTEGALKVLAAKAGLASEIARRFPRLGEIPFSSERALMSTAHEDREAPGRALLFGKGAPDLLLARCTHERVGNADVPLSGERRDAILAGIDALAGEALRTLGLAGRVMAAEDVESLHPGHEQAYVWLGAVGMMDPPRDEARDAVASALRAGVRVIMITGDHPRSALAIARELGLVAGDEAEAVTGARIDALDDAGLRAIAASRSVFARMSPGAQAAADAGAQGRRRDRRDDRRRRQRRAGAQGRRHRHRDGHRGDRRGEGRRRHDPRRRQLRLDRRRDRGRARGLREPAPVPPLPARAQPGRGRRAVPGRGVRAASSASSRNPAS